MKIYFNKVARILNIFIKKNSAISFFLVFGFFLVLFLLVYMGMPTVSSGDDHYFHFRFAEGLMQNGFFDSFKDFKTLYFTNVANGEHLLYYNFLFYVVLIPFTFISPLYLGIKLFAVVFVSLIGVILYLFIKKMDIKYPFLWAIGFFAAIGLSTFWRLFLSRPFVFSPLIILLLIWAIYKKKYLWIFFLSFFTLFWHTATFLVPLGVVLIYFFCYYFYHKKYPWKELLLVFFGIFSSVLVAFLIDYGFFISIRDNLFSVLSSVLNTKVSIVEGGEVYPKNFFDLLNQNLFLCMMFISASVVYVLSFLREVGQVLSLNDNLKPRKIVVMVFFILSSVFMIAINFISNRFSDFFIFFSWIFIVLVFSEVYSSIEFTRLNFKKNIGYAIFICLIYLFSNNALQLNDVFAGGNRPETFSRTGNYLSQNLEKGDIIFNVSWNWFPQLYYYAPEQNYVIGLEPKLTYLHDSRLFWLWQNIGYGFVCENEKCPAQEADRTSSFKRKGLFDEWAKNEGDKIASTIINDFKSHYIVSSGDFSYLNNVLDNNNHFQKVVDDSSNRLFVYKIID